MERIYIVCEGPTEEKFIKDLLAPYLLQYAIVAIPICVHGVSNYRNIVKVIRPLCGDKSAYVTTMLDYYAFPLKDLNYEKVENNIYATVENCEKAIFSSMNYENFIPNLVLHEFEGLLFSDVDKFECCMSAKQVEEVRKIRNKFATPEHVNNNYDTTPSRRIKGVFPEYDKVIDGSRIATRVGLDTICKECKHFGSWIGKIKALSKLTYT